MTYYVYILADRRNGKLRLIEQTNPDWRDLYDETLGLDSSLRWNDSVEWIWTLPRGAPLNLKTAKAFLEPPSRGFGGQCEST
ncbi:MAG: hypothetical protein Q8P59_05240 [Dehalococcoidia bacterium]|nr:hypothetical protein [Dehalococcoidia bacterium]